MRLIACTLLLALATASLDAIASCDYRKKLNHVFPAADLKRVEINALAGNLEVTGNSSDEVVFKGNACSDEQQYLDRITLDVDNKKGVLTLTVVIPYREPDFRARTAIMDVEISLPRNLEIAIRDSSGDMEVVDAAVTRIDDSSGNIKVDGGNASLSIKDSSGWISVKKLKGNLKIGDSSGDISVGKISGDVYIPHDSSGDIDISDVEGGVTIDQDGAGSIDIQHVGRGVQIGSDGSGGIEVEDVTNNVHIGNDGSGYVSIHGIKGDFTMDAKGSGSVRIRDVAGRVSTPR